MPKIIRNSRAISPVIVVLAILLIVVFISAGYGISVSIGQYIPTWALFLVLGLLGIGLVLFFKDKSD